MRKTTLADLYHNHPHNGTNAIILTERKDGRYTRLGIGRLSDLYPNDRQVYINILYEGTDQYVGNAAYRFDADRVINIWDDLHDLYLFLLDASLDPSMLLKEDPKSEKRIVTAMPIENVHRW